MSFKKKTIFFKILHEVQVDAVLHARRALFGHGLAHTDLHMLTYEHMFASKTKIVRFKQHAQ